MTTRFDIITKFCSIFSFFKKKESFKDLINKLNNKIESDERLSTISDKNERKILNFIENMDDIKDGLNILTKKIQKNQFKELSYNDNKDIFVGEYYYYDLLEICEYDKYSFSYLSTEDYFKLIQKNLMSDFLDSSINTKNICKKLNSKNLKSMTALDLLNSYKESFKKDGIDLVFSPTPVVGLQVRVYLKR